MPSVKSKSNEVQHLDEAHYTRSLFERLIHGEGGFCILNQQVRMGRFLLEAVQKTIKSESSIHGNILRNSDFNELYLQRPEMIVL